MKCSGPYKFLTVVLILSLAFQQKLPAQDTVARESANSPPAGEVMRTLLVPAVLIGTGIATMYDRGWYSSYDAQQCIEENYPGFYVPLENYLMFLPAAGVYGLNLAGIKGKYGFADRSIIYLVSMGLTMATTGILKSGTGVERPDGSDLRSFPSNHAAIAFVSAAFLHEEFRDRSIWYGIAGYSIATFTGVLRMLNNKHWMSDVLVGAGLGILWTKALYLCYPAIRNSFPGGYSRKNNNLSLAPYLSRGYYGFSLHYTIH